jgi:TonB family protein
MAALLNARTLLGKLAPLLLVTAAIHAQTFPSSTPPCAIKTTTPTYTKEAAEAKVEGTVVLAFTVESDGKASEITVIRGLGKGLDEKAVESLAQWRFAPARNGMGTASAKAGAEMMFRLSQAQATNSK